MNDVANSNSISGFYAVFSDGALSTLADRGDIAGGDCIYNYGAIAAVETGSDWDCAIDRASETLTAAVFKSYLTTTDPSPGDKLVSGAMGGATFDGSSDYFPQQRRRHRPHRYGGAAISGDAGGEIADLAIPLNATHRLFAGDFALARSTGAVFGARALYCSGRLGYRARSFAGDRPDSLIRFEPSCQNPTATTKPPA